MANQLQEKEYTIMGREHVEDENNEPICVKPCGPVTVNASSLDEAKRDGERELQRQINSYRSNRGDLSKGYFTAEVHQVKDSKGKVLYEA